MKPSDAIRNMRLNNVLDDQPSRSRAVNLGALWRALEELRAAYARGVAKPVEAFAWIRAYLVALDVPALMDQHPHVEGIIASTLDELDHWESTWPDQPGKKVSPSAFGALALIEESAAPAAT